jgi:uncharacterized protein YycO
MRNKLLFSALLITLIIGTLFAKENADAEIKDGDIIFHTSNSDQSKPIQLAMKSKYSHCGIIYKKGNDIFVYEAVGPVKLTPIKEWIARGKNNSYVIKRLKNAENMITPDVLKKMKQVGDKFKGKPYDKTFEWSDNRIYCSELVWKIYQQATGIEIGKLQKLKEFDLSDARVKAIMKTRYPNKIPTEEIVISPAAIFDSDLLVTVKSK